MEDYVLTAWSEHIQKEHGPQHLSLHFDGVRVAQIPGKSTETLCADSEQHILAVTGFAVKIREKKHQTVLQLVDEISTKAEGLDLPKSNALKVSGNCILHLVCLGYMSSDDCEKKLNTTESEFNTYMQQRGCRTYNQYSVMAGCSLFAIPFCMVERLPAGKWLLHLENGSCPHCVAVCVVDEESPVTVWDIGVRMELSHGAFFDALRNGIDRSSAVIFTFSDASFKSLANQVPGPCLTDADQGQLLDISAAGRSVECDSGSSEELYEIEDSDDSADAEGKPDNSGTGGRLCLVGFKRLGHG